MMFLLEFHQSGSAAFTRQIMGFETKVHNIMTKAPSLRSAKQDTRPGTVPDTVIVIPAYNEEVAIAGTIREYAEAFPTARIVVVDNNSSDSTSKNARAALRPDVDLLLFEPRQGKGHAVKLGLSRLSAEIFIMTDGDLTYPAEDARALYDKILATRSDMIVGDRRAGGTYEQQNDRLGHSFGNSLLTTVISRLSGKRYNDVLSGLRIMSSPFVSSLDIRSAGFQLETEINLVAAYIRADVIEEPISYLARAEGSDSKLSTLKDGVKILSFAMLNWIAFLPMQFFSIVAAIGWVLSLMLAYRVVFGFMETGATYSTTAIAGATFGIVGTFAFFTGLSLRIQLRSERRREVSVFLDRKRVWNARLDAKALLPKRDGVQK